MSTAYHDFAKDFITWIRAECEDWWGDEISVTIMPMLEKHGLAQRVAYDPELHGEICEAEPGNEIWVLTEPKA